MNASRVVTTVVGGLGLYLACAMLWWTIIYVGLGWFNVWLRIPPDVEWEGPIYLRWLALLPPAVPVLIFVAVRLRKRRTE